MNQQDMFDELEDTLNIYFYDAVTGKPIPNATVRFDGERARTNRKGMASFSFPMDLGVGDESRTAYFKKSGYVSSKLSVHFAAGSIWFNRYSVSPSLPLDKLRVVLDWDRSPGDLDAHLKKRGSYHISYRDRKSYEDKADLDRDDRDGYGPETITLNELDESGTYDFYVHDYSNRNDSSSTALSERSKAHVRIYSRNGVEKEFRVPTKKKGRVWKVFTIKNGKIIETNTVVK